MKTEEQIKEEVLEEISKRWIRRKIELGYLAEVIKLAIQKATLAERESIIGRLKYLECVNCKIIHTTDEEGMEIDFDLKKLSEGSEKEVVSRDALGQCSTTSKMKKLPSEKLSDDGKKGR